MVAAPAASSAAGLLALLDDSDEKLQRYALTNLDKVVEQFWFQISASIASVEALYEDDEFPDRELAALLASKVDGAPQGAPIDAFGRSGSAQQRPPAARRCSTTSASWTRL
jgi:hypothetical protein